jgi:hypothetical protein
MTGGLEEKGIESAGSAGALNPDLPKNEYHSEWSEAE